MKRSLSVLATLAVVAGTSLPALAQTPAAPAPHSQGVGIQASWLSGSGITYRRWLADGWGLQVAAFPYFTGDYYFFNPGGQVMKELFRNDTFRAYGLAGIGMATYGSSYSGSGYQLGIPVGGGVDWFWGDTFAWTFGLGYTLAFQSTSTRPSFTPGGTFGFMLEW